MRGLQTQRIEAHAHGAIRLDGSIRVSAPLESEGFRRRSSGARDFGLDLPVIFLPRRGAPRHPRRAEIQPVADIVQFFGGGFVKHSGAVELVRPIQRAGVKNQLSIGCINDMGRAV